MSALAPEAERSGRTRSAEGGMASCVLVPVPEGDGAVAS